MPAHTSRMEMTDFYPLISARRVRVILNLVMWEGMSPFLRIVPSIVLHKRFISKLFAME